MNREQCLKAAIDAVNDRPNAYGPPEDNFSRVARLWNAHLQNGGAHVADIYTGEPLPFEPVDVAIFLALVKIARLVESPNHADSWVDLAGYAACGAEVATGVEEDWLAATVSATVERWRDAAAEEGTYQYDDCRCEVCRSS